MFAVLISILAVMVVLALGIEIMMRMRLTSMEFPKEKLYWWRCGGDEVSATYHELFPHSRLPVLRELPFWIVLSVACMLLLFILWKRS
jgi:hypothetical protein